jgi:hypothetical protein
MTFEHYQDAFHPRIGRRLSGGGLERKQRGGPAQQSAAQKGLHEFAACFEHGQSRKYHFAVSRVSEPELLSLCMTLRSQSETWTTPFLIEMFLTPG